MAYWGSIAAVLRDVLAYPRGVLWLRRWMLLMLCCSVGCIAAHATQRHMLHVQQTQAAGSTVAFALPASLLHTQRV